jgi:hypothetical protein
MQLNHNLRYNEKFVKAACNDNESKLLAILIQYIKNAKTIYDMYSNNTLFVNEHLVNVLFQIYMPLAHLINKFTHYDLNYENVLIYKPIENGIIEYIYHLDKNETVTFNSPYIVKIIDYGRCYFNDGGDESSENVKRLVSNVCNGNNLGFKYLFYSPSISDSKSNFITSSIYNQSHDLRLLHMLKLKNINVPTDILNIYNKLKYANFYGTPPMESGYPTSLNNCHDAYLFLKDIINNPSYQTTNSIFDRDMFIKIGELHIYADGNPVKFIKTKNLYNIEIFKIKFRIKNILINFLSQLSTGNNNSVVL